MIKVFNAKEKGTNVSKLPRSSPIVGPDQSQKGLSAFQYDFFTRLTYPLRP